MITSYSNPLVKRIKRLHRKKYREVEDAYFIEGLLVVLSAVEAYAPIEVLVYSSELLTSAIAVQMLDTQRSAGRRCVELSAEVFRSISNRDNPVGLGAVVTRHLTPLETIAVKLGNIYVALNQVAEPGNLGSVLRTMDATGAAGLFIVGSSVDPFHPTTVKASMGAIYTVPITLVPDATTLLDFAANASLQTTATTAKGKNLFWLASYQLPALLVMGSEREGLSSQVLEKADQTVSIPMAGDASSLNLAVATGVLLYELVRQQR